MVPDRSDPLAVVLDALRLSGALYFRSDVGGTWGVAVPRSKAAHFHLVERGRAVVVAGGTMFELHEGDLALLPRGVDHRLASSVDAPDVPLARVLELAAAQNWRLSVGRGRRPRARVLCGYIDVGAGDHHPLVAALPPVVHVPRAMRGSFGAVIRALSGEASSGLPGAASIITRLCEAVFCLAARHWLASQPALAAGWLAALCDPVTRRALIAIHGDLARPWTVDELARVAGQSRAALARRFVEQLGEPPLRYITRMRMLAAAQLLESPGATLAEISELVGYGSVEAFSRAFKRQLGRAPSDVRAARRA